MSLALSDLKVEIERYQLSATYEYTWDVTWYVGSYGGNCIHRWLLVALWKARVRAKRHFGDQER